MTPDDVLGTSRPAVSVFDFSRDQIVAFLRSRLADKDVDAAYLIGSEAAGSADAWSDIDIIIVQRTDLPFLERARRFADLFDLGLPVDVLVYTPAEFQALEEDPTAFWRTAGRQRIKIM